jgi:hypothetical protein
MYPNGGSSYAAVLKDLGITEKQLPVYNVGVLAPYIAKGSGSIIGGYSDGADWDFSKIQGGTAGGDKSNNWSNSGDRPYTEAEKEAIFKGTNPPMINPQTGEVQQPAGKNYVPPTSGQSVQAAIAPRIFTRI